MTSTFKNLLKIELTKAIKNKFFVTTLIIGLVFTLLSAWYSIDLHLYTKSQLSDMGGNQMTQAFTIYNHWIGGEVMSLGFLFFFTLIPLLAVMPYGWSYHIENKTGYVKTVVTRSSKREYFLTKYIATFIAGGLVVLIPLVVNFAVVALFIPAVTPTMSYNLYYMISHLHMGSQLFHTYPFLFVILYLIIDFIFAGLFATMSLAVSFFVKNRISIILIPFFFILILHYSRTFLSNIYIYELSPINYLHSTMVEQPTNYLVVLTQGLLFFILTFGITIGLGGKREIL